MAPAIRHVNPGARSRHLQWDFSLKRPLPPYGPATQEQAPHSATHSSVNVPLLTKQEAEQVPDGQSNNPLY